MKQLVMQYVACIIANGHVVLQIEPLIPHEVLDAINWSSDMSVDDIVAGIKPYDAAFHDKYYAFAVAQNRRLRFVASIDLSAFPRIRARVHPALVDEEHPAYSAKDDEIAFGLSSLLYQVNNPALNSVSAMATDLLDSVQPRPLVLKGSGTGASAGATGVLRDVVTILNTLNGKHHL